jgi:hypothetical protein
VTSTLNSQVRHRIKTRVVLGLFVLASALLLAACGSSSDPSQKPFRSYDPDFKPPASEYSGPFFKLSQDYPTQMPPASEVPSFLKTNFRADWRAYIMQARSYCLEGNTEVDWNVEKNKVRPWYNMPWQDWGPNGREAIRGLTREAPLAPYQLAPDQTYGEGAAYAIGFYNSFGAYTIGQVWKNHNDPDPDFASTHGFPNGTVVCKLLFLSAPAKVISEQIPFLENPIEWKAYTETTYGSKERVVREVPLIQMDIMVRDKRAPAGWVFGTFQYNGRLQHHPLWRNLAPVGLMWGNDPEEIKNIPVTDSNDKFPAPHAITETPINPRLEETAINPRSELPPTHLGWNGRLNGPVDNPLSSCMSCHMTASSPEKPLSPLFTAPEERPSSGTPEWGAWWMQWFQNIGWKGGVLEKFMKAEYALDFSLQLSAALQNFYQSEEGIKPEYRVRR